MKYIPIIISALSAITPFASSAEIYLDFEGGGGSPITITFPKTE